MTNPSLLELPRGVQLVYLAEGGANVIYRFVTAPIKSSLVVREPKRPVSPIMIDEPRLPAGFQGKLLRLRKKTAGDISYKEINRNFNTIVRPLFRPEELVDQSLILLPGGLIQRCNEQLVATELNGQRPKKRHGGYLCADEPFGLLITDMTTFDTPGATLAELKPKWLMQSPSAPPMARRCRTCALREMKNHDARSSGSKEQRSFCPLDLVSGCFEDVLRATTFIKGCNDRARLARILYHNPVLHTLRAQQTSLAQVGLLGPPALSQKPSLDMTLRDCTMFIKIPHDDKSPVEIRLGDLDLKTGSGGKSTYWRKIELQLLDGGWYSGSNSSQDPSECALQYTKQ
ncbi:Inositol-pentakisphosphate 2-kinase [Penicillium sp. IBT 16267x]|nr:Inositol-pentakisphosphate 2-kinase [Penicillium sp. IBT 16267x]